LLNSALAARGLAASATDLRARRAPWPGILERTGSGLDDDLDSNRLAEGTLAPAVFLGRTGKPSWPQEAPTA
jgi:hypothetical protein